MFTQDRCESSRGRRGALRRKGGRRALPMGGGTAVVPGTTPNGRAKYVLRWCALHKLWDPALIEGCPFCGGAVQAVALLDSSALPKKTFYLGATVALKLAFFTVLG